MRKGGVHQLAADAVPLELGFDVDAMELLVSRLCPDLWDVDVAELDVADEPFA